MGQFLIIGLLLLSTSTVTVYCQEDITEYLANNLQVIFTVISNFNENPTASYTGRIDLTNTGNTFISNNTWEIYFCSIRLMEPDILYNKTNDGAELGTSKVKVYQLAGCLHKLKPMDGFEGFPPQEIVELPFVAEAWSVSRTDVMPRWYVTTDNSTDALTIVSTASEALDFVADFNTPEQWKRSEQDRYDPFSPQERFDRIVGADQGTASKAIIPTPFYQDISEDKYIDITTGDWQVVYSSDDVMAEAMYLAEKLGTDAVNIDNKPSSRYIQLNLGTVSNLTNQEAYETIVIAGDTPIVNITGITTAGVFYGVQTFLSLAAFPDSIPHCTIIDYPRFPYRGMHLDTSRNFQSKDEVLKMIDVMSMYKLNHLYFHFTDDEGWRLEIPGIEEATEVGSKRCFDPTEQTCILSQLGSGPTTATSGSGHYTADDYREILQFAKDRHITVIPEFDMPGHGHAIIRAMEARYNKYIGTDEAKATEYLLSDPNDESDYFSNQIYTRNAFNPCMNSTYNFIEYLISQVKLLHETIQPLTVFNYGGDEVPAGAFEGSPICKEFVSSRPDLNLTKESLQRYFAIRVAEIAHAEGLNLAAWEDGLSEANEPYNRTVLPNDNAYVYTWNNVWEDGTGERAYIFANQDYKVILAHATHLYFDHPQEPDPEERGYYWATRFTDTYKTFSYMPDEVYNNIDVTKNGDPIDKEEFCEPKERCIPLNETKRPNIIGIQGELWSETTRSVANVESMIFPRFLALAERAWHKAVWEDSFDTVERDRDWEDFANTLGHKELARLDHLDIQYNIPPPGARIQDSDGTLLLEAKSKFPGLNVLYSTDNQVTWTSYKQPVAVPPNSQIYLQVRSANNGRHSRIVMIETSGNVSGTTQVINNWKLLSMLLFFCLRLL